MRLCFIADASTVHAQKWVRFFTGRDHEVHVISYWPPGDGDMGQVKLHILKRLSLGVRIIVPLINLVLSAIQVRSLLKKIKPDIIHAHYITDNGFVGVMSGFHPLVISAWGSDVLIDPKRYPLVRMLDKYILRKADSVTCDSDTLKKGLLELGANESKVSIIYHGVDTRQFEPRNRDERLKSSLGIAGVTTVISTRGLSPVYNLEMFIKSMPLILKKVSAVKFIIAGDGSQRKYLQDMVNSLGVSNAVRFVGWIPHDKLPEYLISSDVYVSTSLSDSTALSLQEAMACELAPVVTNLPANQEWVTHGENGFLVPVGDHEKLADGIVYLLMNKERRDKFGKAGRKLIMERAEYQREMGNMERIYQKLLKK